VTQTSTTFRPTTLDIEHLFGLVSAHRTDVLSAECPGRRVREPPKEAEMAFTRVDPVAVHVRTDWFSGRPREITWGAERLPITSLAVVREEAAAYPVITGPRTMFEVETPRARLALAYQHRSKRWTVTALDEAQKAA
jgi:hypothetical protein